MKGVSTRKSSPVRTCALRELWCHLLDRDGPWKWVRRGLSHYLFTGAIKSMTDKWKIVGEVAKICSGYVKSLIPLSSVLKSVYFPLAPAKMRQTSGFGRKNHWPLLRGVAAAMLALYPREHVRAIHGGFPKVVFP